MRKLERQPSRLLAIVADADGEHMQPRAGRFRLDNALRHATPQKHPSR
jgi:hypothetical protein